MRRRAAPPGDNADARFDKADPRIDMRLRRRAMHGQLATASRGITANGGDNRPFRLPDFQEAILPLQQQTLKPPPVILFGASGDDADVEAGREILVIVA